MFLLAFLSCFLVSFFFDQIASFKLKQIVMYLKRSVCVFKLISLRYCDRFRLLNRSRFVQGTACSRPFNPRTYKVGGRGGGLSFFLEDKTSAPDIFSSCSFIPCAHFETSLVIISVYGYEI